MNSFFNRILNFGLLAVMAGVGAAQAGQQAWFHLPFEAKWNGMVLPAGDYTLTEPQLSFGPQQFFVKGTDARGFIAPMSIDTDGNRLHAEHTYLRLVKVDGTFYVSKYESGPHGTAFTFKVPRASHRVEMTSREVFNVEIAGN